MTTTAELREKIIAICYAMQDADHRAVEDAIDQASDYLSRGERSDDLWFDSVLDGIRWGHRAAGCVEMGGSTLLRICEPGGLRLTHEWHGGISDEGRAMVMETVRKAMAKGESK